MLVKVRNDDPSRLSSTERTVVNWLKSWSGPHAVPGIAIVQCQDADVVVWTPQTCVVIAVHGFTERVNGTLHCAEDEAWKVDDAPAPIDGDANPLERVRQQTTELARQLRAAPGREHVPVSGLVLVVPQLGSRLKLSKGAMPPGIDVLLGDGPSSLRSYFTKLAEGAVPAWDAAQVGQALGALGFAAAATYSDLVLEGFGTPSADRTPPPSLAPTRSVPSVPVAPPHVESGSGGGSPQTGGVVPGPAAVPVTNPTAGAGGRDVAGAQQDPPSTGRGSGGQAARVAGAAAAGAVAGAAAGAVLRGSAQRSPSGTEGQTGQGSGGGQGFSEQSGAGGPGQGGQGYAPGQGGATGPGGQGSASGPGGQGSASRPGAQGATSGSAPQGAASGPGGAPSAPAGTPGAPAQRPGFASGPAPYVPGSAPTRPGAPGQPFIPSRSGGLPPGAQPVRSQGAPSGPGGQSATPPTAGPGFPLWNNAQQTTSRRRRRDLPVVAALLVVFLFLAVAAMCTRGVDTTSEEHPTGHITTTRTTTSPTKTDPSLPSTTFAPACFPFQPGC